MYPMAGGAFRLENNCENNCPELKWLTSSPSHRSDSARNRGERLDASESSGSESFAFNQPPFLWRQANRLVLEFDRCWAQAKKKVIG